MGDECHASLARYLYREVTPICIVCCYPLGAGGAFPLGDGGIGGAGTLDVGSFGVAPALPILADNVGLKLFVAVSCLVLDFSDAPFFIWSKRLSKDDFCLVKYVRTRLKKPLAGDARRLALDCAWVV